MVESTVERKGLLLTGKKIYSYIILVTKSNQEFSNKPLIFAITRKPGDDEKDTSIKGNSDEQQRAEENLIPSDSTYIMPL